MKRWMPATLGLAGVVSAASALAAWWTCDCAKLPLEGELARVVAGLSFVVVGLIAWIAQGNHRVGLLMSAVGLTWFIDDLGWIYAPLPYTIAAVGRASFQPVLAHLVVAFPSGRLRSSLDRRLIATTYIAWFGITMIVTALWDPADDCLGCSTNLLLLHHDSNLHDLAEQASTVLVLTLSIAVAALVVWHWFKASVAGRRALAPVLWAAAPLGVVVIAYSLIGRSWIPPLAPLALTVLPVGLLVGLLRMRLYRAAVGRLVIELCQTLPPGGLRDALARTLADPSLQVAYWIPERSSFVDADGSPMQLPVDASAGQLTAMLERDGQPIAALIHDAALEDDPELVAAAGAAARLAIENERLQADIRAQLNEVRTSRARLVEAAAAERRRIERDLHDGSQQRLVTLALTLGLARSRLGPDADSELARALREASEQLNLALAELRELARGIHPAILTESGLSPALVSLAERSSVPVVVASVLTERLPAPVEVAAYFVVAEALANVAKHAAASKISVRVERVDGCVVVEVIDDGVGGANLSHGSGLQGLADRVGALDGRLQVVSPDAGGTRVIAVIPCS